MLTSCPTCGNSVSTKAFSCPQCGHPLKQQPVIIQKGGLTFWGVVGAIIVAVIILSFE